MTALANTAALASLSLVAAYGLGRITGPSIKTEIEIDAPAHTVWKVLTGADAFSEWNPFVKSMAGDLKAGNTLAITVQPDGKSAMKFAPKVLKANPNQELRWLGKLGFKGIFDGEHYFVLEETPRGTTILRHGETFRGLLAYPLFAMIGKDTRTGFEAMNQALKARVEARA